MPALARAIASRARRPAPIAGPARRRAHAHLQALLAEFSAEIEAHVRLTADRPLWSPAEHDADRATVDALLQRIGCPCLARPTQ